MLSATGRRRKQFDWLSCEIPGRVAQILVDLYITCRAPATRDTSLTSVTTPWANTSRITVFGTVFLRMLWLPMADYAYVFFPCPPSPAPLTAAAEIALLD